VRAVKEQHRAGQTVDVGGADNQASVWRLDPLVVRGHVAGCSAAAVSSAA